MKNNDNEYEERYFNLYQIQKEVRNEDELKRKIIPEYKVSFEVSGEDFKDIHLHGYIYKLIAIKI